MLESFGLIVRTNSLIGFQREIRIGLITLSTRFCWTQEKPAERNVEKRNQKVTKLKQLIILVHLDCPVNQMLTLMVLLNLKSKRFLPSKKSASAKPTRIRKSRRQLKMLRILR